jgi:S1-C subfamily serine protease
MTVRIRNIGCGELSTGTGFAIDDHTLVTNRHVVSGLATLQVATYDGRDIAVADAASATVADLAIVHTKDALPAIATLAETDPQTGDHVTIVGYPSGGPLTLSDGIILGTQDDPLQTSLGQVLVSDALVQPGSSGSPVLDDAGLVVGVVYAKSEDNRTYIVPISTLQSMLADPKEFTTLKACS